MKLAILYHSKSGNTAKIAKIIEEGALEVKGIEVKTMNIDKVDYDFLEEAKCVIFGCPTYYGDFSWQIKKWFDESQRTKLGGKLGAMFATENHIGGGADVALLTLAGHMLVKGMLVYSSGSSEGNPYTHFGAVSIKDGDDFQRERAKIFGKRIASKAAELF